MFTRLDTRKARWVQVQREKFPALPWQQRQEEEAAIAEVQTETLHRGGDDTTATRDDSPHDYFKHQPTVNYSKLTLELRQV
eukprot:599431-Amphidinium_carterae.2